MLGWCLDPASPDLQAIDEACAEAESPSALAEKRDNLNFKMMHMADRAGRMLWSLFVEGFASFG